jgi:pimeloyl-ACP methyl ester carboxylesterase
VDFGNPLLKKWTADVPRVSLSVLPRAGRLPWIDQPAALIEALRQHLEAPGSPRPSGL